MCFFAKQACLQIFCLLTSGKWVFNVTFPPLLMRKSTGLRSIGMVVPNHPLGSATGTEMLRAAHSAMTSCIALWSATFRRVIDVLFKGTVQGTDPYMIPI